MKIGFGRTVRTTSQLIVAGGDKTKMKREKRTFAESGGLQKETPRPESSRSEVIRDWRRLGGVVTRGHFVGGLSPVVSTADTHDGPSHIEVLLPEKQRNNREENVIILTQLIIIGSNSSGDSEMVTNCIQINNKALEEKHSMKSRMD